MQSQPFVIERLNIDRRDDLYAASLETRFSTSSGRTMVGRGAAWIVAALHGLRPHVQAKAGASTAHPVASR